MSRAIMLEMTLLGRPQIKLNKVLLEVNANKALALIYYLAATGRPHSRQALAALLWSDLPEEAARRNLRVELTRIKDSFEPYLLIARDSLAFNPEASYTLDLARFEATLRQTNPTLEELQTAISLYQGDFLEDFHVRDAPLFEEWMENERERLAQALQRLILRLAVRCLEQKLFPLGLNVVELLLTRAPWLEEAHQVKMHLLARSGQRAAALAQYDICSLALKKEFNVLPSEETEELYNQIEAGEIRPDGEEGATLAFASSAAPLPPPFQAPQPLLHFVGRENELAALQDWLAKPASAQAYALVGMGGLGKSTLATHFAHALRQEFSDGVLWANVASSEPLDILGNWARAYGYDFSTLSDVENRASALRSVLADKKTLIVLDDVRSVARTRPLLLGGPQCVTLLTTRDLDVAVALNAHPHNLHELTPKEGHLLLTRILGETRVAAEPAAAQEICTLLQNLPLAVEITAQRLASRPRRRLADMAERLRTVEERLDLAISDRAVRTSFMVSWESLDIQLRRIFSLLGVFEGRSFSASAIAHIAELDKYTAEDRLFSLTALSLVSEEGQDRYRQHPLLADFAGEQLGNDVEAKISMATYYQAFAEQHRTNYDMLRPEWDNLMEGMNMAHTLHQWPLVLAYADTLTQPWFVRARYFQARRGYILACDAATALANEQAEARYLQKWAEACIEQNDYGEAMTLLTHSLTIFERLEDEVGIGDVKFWQARIMHDKADYAEARHLLDECLAIRKTQADQTGIAAVIYWQAGVLFRTGDYESALHLCQQALYIQEQQEDKLGQIRTLRLFTDISLIQENLDSAYNYCQHAINLCHELADQGELAASYYSMANIMRKRNELTLAQKYAEEALLLFQRMGDRRFQAATLYEISMIQERARDYEGALTVRLQSTGLFREQEDLFNLVVALLYLGDLYKVRQESTRANQTWEEALSLARLYSHPFLTKLQERLSA